MDARYCPHCGTQIPVDAHPYRRYCNMRCVQRAWYKANKERARAARRRCDLRKGPDFYKLKRRKWLSIPANRQRFNLERRLWRKNNLAKAREMDRIRYRKNPEKVFRSNRIRRYREKGFHGFHTRDEWQTLKMEYHYTCPSCLRREPEIKLERDHIIPLVKGGSDFIANIQPLCSSCNSSKYVNVIKYAHPSAL